MQDSCSVFDLSKDPFEQHNILGQMPAGTDTVIKQKLAAWVQYQAKLMRERILPGPAGRK